MPDEIFTLAQAQRVAVMLGVEPSALKDGDAAPRGWHFALLAGQTPRRDLRMDGFPGLGVPMPQLDLPRLVLGGRSTTFRGELILGAPLRRDSVLSGIESRSGRNGAFAVARVDHRLTCGAAEIAETHTYILTGPPAAAQRPAPLDAPPGLTKVVTPDELMLFQYSALGFNTHRIHFDRQHARSEGYADLVVNGGLASLLATEFLREMGLRPASMIARHLAPLYVNRPLTLLFVESKVLILDQDGVLAAELGMTFDDL